MKKLLTILTSVGLARFAYGQSGYVGFYNNAGYKVSTNSIAGPLGGSGPAMVLRNPVASSYYYALLVAPLTQNTITTAADPTQNGWTFTGDIATNNTTISGTFSMGADQAAFVPGYSGGSVANFAVVGWSANIGSTWAQAESWWNNGDPQSNEDFGTYYNFGISTVATNIPVEPAPGPYNYVFGLASSGLIPGMTLGTYFIPEPATLALTGLGAAALVIFRRRK